MIGATIIGLSCLVNSSPVIGYQHKIQQHTESYASCVRDTCYLVLSLITRCDVFVCVCVCVCVLCMMALD